MNEETQPVPELTDDAVQALLRRAVRNCLILGLIAAIALWIGSGWRNAAMLATGAVISAGSILEWQRLTRVINARLDNQQSPRGAPAVVTFFVLRLGVFAVMIYGSLKCFQGSAVALLCGLGFAAVAVAFEALRLMAE
jgi:uncharacterized membrane protein